jgi:L-iditol 2-dehydrogenase
MKALMLSAIRELQIQDVPQPEIARPDDVLIRVGACGICGSDLHGYTGQSGRRVPPLIMGHEASGEVVEAGPAASQFRSGDRVALQPLTSCGTCPACMDGKLLWCPQRSLMGMNAPGAYADYVVWPAANLFRIPDVLSFEHAALAEPVAVALHAVSRVRLKPYETAVVIGAGTIGLLVLALLRRMGLRRLVAVDISERRLAVAQKLGADVTLNPSVENVVPATREAVGEEGVDHVFEAVGVPDTFQTSIQLARQGGEAVWIGNNERYAEIDVQAVVTREINIRSSYGFTPVEFGRAVALLADGCIPADEIVTLCISLHEGPRIFEELLNRPDVVKCLFRFTP